MAAMVLMVMLIAVEPEPTNIPIAWMVGGPEEVAANCACDAGYITNGEEHNGMMPDKLALWSMVAPFSGSRVDRWARKAMKAVWAR